MTDEISFGSPAPDPDPAEVAPPPAEPTPGQWFGFTAATGLGLAGLAVGFLGLLGVSAGNGFAQVFGFSTADTLRTVVVAQAATNAAVGVIGLLLAVAGSGRARRGEDRVAGVIATAGIVVSAVAVVVQVAVIVAAFVHGTDLASGLQLSTGG